MNIIQLNYDTLLHTLLTVTHITLLQKSLEMENKIYTTKYNHTTAKTYAAT